MGAAPSLMSAQTNRAVSGSQNLSLVAGAAWELEGDSPWSLSAGCLVLHVEQSPPLQSAALGVGSSGQEGGLLWWYVYPALPVSFEEEPWTAVPCV